MGRKLARVSRKTAKTLGKTHKMISGVRRGAAALNRATGGAAGIAAMSALGVAAPEAALGMAAVKAVDHNVKQAHKHSKRAHSAAKKLKKMGGKGSY